MLAINTWSPPSSVYFSERLHDNALVIAKSNRIEVLHIAPLGLVHQCGLDIWGTVSSLQIISGENKVCSLCAYFLDSLDPRLDRCVESHTGDDRPSKTYCHRARLRRSIVKTCRCSYSLAFTSIRETRRILPGRTCPSKRLVGRCRLI